MSSIRRLVSRSLLLGAAFCAALTLLPAPSAFGDEEAQAPTPILHAAVSENDTILLLGTLHTRHRDVVAVHPTTAEALKVADVLIGEIKLDDTLRLRMLPYIQLPRNRPLNSLLGEALQKRVEALLAKHNDDLDSWQRYVPWLLESRLGELLLPGDELVKTSLDEVLQERAADRDLEVEGLEKLREQLGPFLTMSFEDQVAMLEDTVSLIEKDQAAGRNTSRQLVAAWQSGDADKVMAEVNRYFDMGNERDRKLYTQMHDERNARMLARLLAGAKKTPNKVRMVAVGAMHLPGKNGLLKGLAREGYVVWHVGATGEVPASHEAARTKAAAVSPAAVEAPVAIAEDTPAEEPVIVDAPAPTEATPTESTPAESTPARPLDPSEVVVFDLPTQSTRVIDEPVTIVRRAPMPRGVVRGPSVGTVWRTPATAAPSCTCPPRPCRPRRCWPFPFGRRR